MQSFFPCCNPSRPQSCRFIWKLSCSWISSETLQSSLPAAVRHFKRHNNCWHVVSISMFHHHMMQKLFIHPHRLHDEVNLTVSPAAHWCKVRKNNMNSSVTSLISVCLVKYWSVRVSVVFNTLLDVGAVASFTVYTVTFAYSWSIFSTFHSLSFKL